MTRWAWKSSLPQIKGKFLKWTPNVKRTQPHPWGKKS
jgi:hypothetical protein